MKLNHNISTAQFALDAALEKGCNDVRITLNESRQNTFTFRNDQLDRLQQATSSSLFLQLYVDGKYGTFSTNKTDRKELLDFISKGVEITKLITEDKDRGLPDKNLYYRGGGEGKDLRQYDNLYSDISTEQKINIAKECNYEILGKDERILNVTSEFSDYEDYNLIIDSQGFMGETEQTGFTISTDCSVKGEKDARPEGWWYESSLFFNKLYYKGCGERALERALKKIDPKKLRSGRYNMIVENTVSSKLVAPIISALNGANIQQNNSFLQNKLGEKVFSPLLEIYDDVHLPESFGARYFDSEGVATKPMKIIDCGIINTYFVNSYYSKKTGLPVTIDSPSVPECYVAGEKNCNIIKDLNFLLNKSVNGVLVTGFNGGNSNSSTGDFSFGIEGFYFENGECLFPVSEMNITGNIISLWNSIIEIGNDPRTSNRWLIPSLLFENVDFNGF